MQLTSAGGVETSHLAKEGMVLHYITVSLCSSRPPFFVSLHPSSRPIVDSDVRTLRAEELARDVEGFTSHDDDLLAIQQLLGDSAGQATKEVSLAVNHDLSLVSDRLICGKRAVVQWSRCDWRGETYNWLEGGHPALLSPVVRKISSEGKEGYSLRMGVVGGWCR